ncbi:hypothetical protein AN639_10660 [Candidatus Epulonipiscium fishelsonii]|uniref:Uncharacterized protein n=1 Tax=Candidatus Epulonipiscium fishelsonii TaxID=77094 RepID=A0ACC8XFC0_9FIRM|nr:hypothetical protein AN396_00415 [Epulopiscium sp. SCG-B11WGA-EpuloA1]ONI43265.1 hypothetical protein AN639_10660 [Epulopiscium sp. SCG-B05WGA-EpuloA1]
MEEKKGCACEGNHKHDENHECKCGGNCECHDEDVIFVTFEDDDKEVACDVLGVFDVEGKDYIAMVPKDEEYSDEVLIYRYCEMGEEMELSEIETDEEFAKVESVFETLFFDEEE